MMTEIDKAIEKADERMIRLLEIIRDLPPELRKRLAPVKDHTNFNAGVSDESQ